LQALVLYNALSTGVKILSPKEIDDGEILVTEGPIVLTPTDSYNTTLGKWQTKIKSAICFGALSPNEVYLHALFDLPIFSTSTENKLYSQYFT